MYSTMCLTNRWTNEITNLDTNWAYNSNFVPLKLLHFAPILLFLGLIFSFLAITHPFHVIGPLTTLAFIIASFHLLPQTSMSHSCLLIHTSSRFHHIPLCSICFIIIPDFPTFLVYINPQLAMYLLKLDLFSTLVHCHTNLVSFPFSCPRLLESLHWCSKPVTCPWNLSPMSRKSLGCILEPWSLPRKSLA